MPGSASRGGLKEGHILVIVSDQFEHLINIFDPISKKKNAKIRDPIKKSRMSAKLFLHVI